MNRSTILMIIATTLLALALGVSVIMAQSTNDTPPFPTYKSTIYPCKYDYADAKEWSAGNTIHVRNSALINYGETEDSKYGVKTIETLSWNFNSKKGEGVVWGPITQEYTNESGELVGTWVGTIEGKVYMDVSGVPLAVGKGVFDGTGQFEGLRMKSSWRQNTHFDQPAEACIGHEPGGEPERPPLPVETLIEHYVIETTGAWPPGE